MQVCRSVSNGKQQFLTAPPLPPQFGAFVIFEQKELHECVQHIQDPPTLRAHVTAMYKSNVSVDVPRNEMDANVIHEYHRHKVSRTSECSACVKRGKRLDRRWSVEEGNVFDRRLEVATVSRVTSTHT